MQKQVGDRIEVKASEGLGTTAIGATILQVFELTSSYQVRCDDGEICDVDEDGEVLI